MASALLTGEPVHLDSIDPALVEPALAGNDEVLVHRSHGPRGQCPACVHEQLQPLADEVLDQRLGALPLAGRRHDRFGATDRGAAVLRLPRREPIHIFRLRRGRGVR